MAHTVLSSNKIRDLAQRLEQTPRGVVIAGPMVQGSQWRQAVKHFCAKTGYPLLAEPLSQLSIDFKDVTVLQHHDHLLRSSWSKEVAPDIVIRLGGPPTCKALKKWLEHHRCPMIMFDPFNSWADPSFTTSEILSVGNEGLSAIAEIIDPTMADPQWQQTWRSANDQASTPINNILDSEPLLQAAVARELGRHLPSDHVLYVSNSMPVRDIDSFMEPHSDSLHVIGNRGASGIDGVISSAAGAAASGQPTTLLIGDLAFQHDMGGLIAARSLDITLTVVVLDDQGGGIFSHLPIAQVTDPAIFEKLFTTPQHLPIAGIVEALGIKYQEVSNAGTLADLVREPQGIRVIRIPIDSSHDIDQHLRIGRAVADSIESS